MKNPFLIWTALLLLMFPACSDHGNEIETDDDILTNTTWTRRLIADKTYGYESFEFLPSHNFILFESDLNGVKQCYLLTGKYTVDGTKIQCTYERIFDTPNYYPDGACTLILNNQYNTIMVLYDNKPCCIFVKQ